jgi:hypothetical protein
MDSLHWEFDSWSATRADDVVLHSILASGSGPDWQGRVREAQKNGETLTRRVKVLNRSSPLASTARSLAFKNATED